MDYKEIVSVFSIKAAQFVNDRPDLLDEIEQNRHLLADYDISAGDAEAVLRDWFLFEAESRTLKENLLAYLLRTGVFSEEECAIFRRFCHWVYGFFKINALKTGKEMRVTDLLTDKDYFIREVSLTRHLRKGQYFAGRVLPFSDYHILWGKGYMCPDDAFKGVFELMVRGIKPAFKDRAAGILDAVSAFFPRREHETLSPEEKIALIGMECGLSRKDIDRFLLELQYRVRHTDRDMLDLKTAFLEKIPPRDNFDADELLKAIQDYWNQLITDKDPATSKGPVEQMLLRAGMDQVERLVNPETYKDIKQANQKAQQIHEQWLHTPLDEFDGKTPAQIILKERQELGNPQKEIGFRVQIEQVQPGKNVMEAAEKFYNEGCFFLESGKPKKALNVYEKYCRLNPSNHVVWHNMAVAHLRQGHNRKGRAYLEKALSIKPDYKMARDKIRKLNEMEGVE